MSDTVTLPAWLFFLLLAFALWAALEWLLLPGARWFFRRKVNRVLQEISLRLKVELPQFKLTRRQVLIDRLFHDPRVQEAAEKEAREKEIPLAAALSRVDRYAREIVPSFNAYLYFRVGYWLGKSAAKLLYRVRLGYTDTAALAAVNPKSSIVFVMNHRSNMDYVLVAFLAAERVALSYAVGEWARIWPLQQLIRSMGAYFVRRSSGDPLYRMVLQRYVQMATEAGVPQAVYPEGGLSVDGKLRPPRLGLLDYMLKVVRSARRARSRVRPGRDQLRPRARGPHAPAEARRGRAAPRLLLRGRQDARLRRRQSLADGDRALVPLRLRVRELRAPDLDARSWVAERSIDFRRLSEDERHQEVERVGRAVMAGGRAHHPRAAGLPGRLRVRRAIPAPGLSELELKSEVYELIRRLEAVGAHIYVPRGDLDYAVGVGLRMLTLRRIVTEEDGLYRGNPGGPGRARLLRQRHRAAGGGGAGAAAARRGGGMIGLMQRVSGASVEVDGAIVAGIGRGLLVLVGVEAGDGEGQADRLLSGCSATGCFPTRRAG